MILSRLDEIVKRNVEMSTQKNVNDRILSTLIDMSETLAMIYDKLNKTDENVENEGEASEEETYVLLFDELKNQHTLYFDAIELTEPYEVNFDCYLVSNDINTNEQKVVVRFIAFGDKMEMDMKTYYKRWRCWNKMPTKEQRDAKKWGK